MPQLLTSPTGQGAAAVPAPLADELLRRDGKAPLGVITDFDLAVAAAH